jgi:hypothetical protein
MVNEVAARSTSGSAAAPGEPQIEARMRVGDLAVRDAAPAEDGDRGRHDRDAHST